MPNSLAVILNVRKNSSRCNNKLLRPFAFSNLFEISLAKVDRLVADEKYLCTHDEEFKDFLIYPSIKFIKRSYESSNVDGPLTKIYEAVNQVASDYFMFLNPCCPNLRVKTIQNAINLFKNSNFVSMTSVLAVRDWMYSENGSVLVDGSKTGDTKNSPVMYKVAHAFHIIDKNRFFENNGLIWTNKVNDPYLYEISKLEAYDVDDELDFIATEAIYRSIFYSH